MIVISGNLVLSEEEAALSLDHPVIGWHNIVTAAAISTSSAQANYPASNLANPATHLEWRGAVVGSTEVIEIAVDEVDPVDYVAVARHNWGSSQISARVDTFDGVDWVPVVDEVMLSDDTPAIFRFAAQSSPRLRIVLQGGTAAPRAAVAYAGKLLVMERQIYVGHTPLPHGRKSSVVNGRSESGNFLGRIVLGSWRESTVPLSLISPAWYRANMDAFLADATRDLPFFFAWRPQSYPFEAGYAWLLDDPAPAPVGPSNLLAFDLKLGGIV